MGEVHLQHTIGVTGTRPLPTNRESRSASAGKIDRITMTNFKCFEEQSIPLAGINVLAGMNATGKSTVVQSLLLLRQTGVGESGKPESLNWRGSLVDLGAFQDVVRAGAERETIGLEAEFSPSDSVGVEIGGAASGTAEMIDSTGFAGASRTSLYRPSMFYLGADRLGPQKTLPYPDREPERQTPLGTSGELVLWYLWDRRHQPVPAHVLHVDERIRCLWQQVNAWLGVISPGAAVHFYREVDVDRVRAGYSFVRDEERPGPFRATNAGFGLSYALPVIVALLSARSDDLVMIENPEAHLHPAGQTKLAELAARAAAAGAQIILETHSDHILDGIRLAVRNGIINPEQTAFHYFQRTDLSVEVKTPSIRKDGRLDFWPDGFFDQHERNLAALVAPR